jgi:predicted metal-dependent hydrolase
MAEQPPTRNLRLLTEEEVEERRYILVDGVAQYNAGYFFEAHETLEELWLPSPWPIRPFLQGIIQMSAGFVHLVRGEYPGTVRLLARAIEKLSAAPDGYLGLDSAQLVLDATRVLGELEALGPDRFQDWDRSGIPKIAFVAVL